MKKTSLMVISVLLVMSLFMTGCASTQTNATTAATTTSAASSAATSAAPSDSGEIIKLRLGMFDVRNSLVTWYIMQNGLDKANGFEIVPTVSTAGGSFLNEAIGAGQLDATIMGAAQGVYSASVYDCITVAEMSDGAGSSGLFARADSAEAKVIGSNPKYPEIRGSADTLKGKTLMYPVGSMSQLTVAKYLELFGLSLDDVNSVNTNYGPGYQALQAGEGDIVALFSPLTLTAVKDGYTQLVSLDQIGVPVRDCLVVTRKAYEDPKLMEAVKKYLKLVFEYNDKFQADKENQRKILAEYFKFYGNEITDPKMLDTEIEKHYLLTTEQAMADIENLGKSTLGIAEFYAGLGIIEEDALEIVKTNVDTSIMKELFGK